MFDRDKRSSLLRQSLKIAEGFISLDRGKFLINIKSVLKSQKLNRWLYGFFPNAYFPNGQRLGFKIQTHTHTLTNTHTREYYRGKYHCNIDLLFDWVGLVCFANKNKNCQLSYSWFQTSQTGGQWYSDTSPFSIPCTHTHTHSLTHTHSDISSSKGQHWALSKRVSLLC
jgi:hypothetical protein